MQIDANAVIEKLKQKLADALAINAVLEVQIEMLDAQLTESKSVRAVGQSHADLDEVVNHAKGDS